MANCCHGNTLLFSLYYCIYYFDNYISRIVDDHVFRFDFQTYSNRHPCLASEKMTMNHHGYVL